MLMTEWNLDDALAVRYEEGWLGGKEEGLEIGLEQGSEQGREEGWLGGKEEGLEEGLEIGLGTTARNALAEGLSIEVVQKITGLDRETLAELKLSL